MLGDVNFTPVAHFMKLIRVHHAVLIRNDVYCNRGQEERISVNRTLESPVFWRNHADFERTR